MQEIILDDEQAEAVRGTKDEVIVRDRRGAFLGRLRPMLPLSEADAIAEATRRASSSQQRFTTAEVMKHLESLEPK